MMRTATTTAVLIAALVCAPVANAADRREALSAEAQQRGAAAPSTGAADAAVIEALLADGLTRNEAVQIALMSNHELRAAFAELGIAEADLRQAGLYSNPSIDTVIRWPDQHGAEIEVEAAWDLADLWRVPVRAGAARARADAVTMTVLARLLNVAADTRMAWDGAVASEAATAEATAVRDAARDLLARMRERLDYGFGEELDIQRMIAEVAEAEVDLAMAEAERGIASARLRRMLGVAADLPVEPVGELPGVPEQLPSTDELTDLALAQRPEIRAAVLGAQAAGLDLRLERRSTWQHVTLGPAYLREPEGAELWGFAVGLELPIADDNRAQRRRAAAELRSAEDLAMAARAMVREEVAIAAERLAFAGTREKLVRETIVPAREQAQQFAQKHYMQMELSMLPVIQTRRELAAARLMHVEARRQVAEALVELQFAVGGTLP